MERPYLTEPEPPHTPRWVYIVLILLIVIPFLIGD